MKDSTSLGTDVGFDDEDGVPDGWENSAIDTDGKFVGVDDVSNVTDDEGTADGATLGAPLVEGPSGEIPTDPTTGSSTAPCSVPKDEGCGLGADALLRDHMRRRRRGD